MRAPGVTARDWKKRRGLMDQDLPHTMGLEAARIVDEPGEGVTHVAVTACPDSPGTVPRTGGGIVNVLRETRSFLSVLRTGVE